MDARTPVWFDGIDYPYVFESSGRCETVMLDGPQVRSKIVRATVYLDILGENKAILARGTGCLVSLGNKAFLLTCWHLLTVIDYLSRTTPKSLVPPLRRYLRVGFQDVYLGSIRIGAPDSIVTRADAAHIEIELYKKDNGGYAPRWIQAQSDFQPERPELGQIRIPDNVDVAAIEVPLTDFQREHLCLRNDYFKNAIPYQGRPVSVIGYPNGLSLGGPRSALPVWITRFMASMRGDRRGRGFEFLLDGACFPGMSGSPVIYAANGGIWIIGLYLGSLTMNASTHSNTQIEVAQQLGLFIGFHTISTTLRLPLTNSDDFTEVV